MDTQIEKWKDEVLESLNEMDRAEPSPFLFAKIRERVQASTGITVKPAYLRLAFATLALLFILNISAIVRTSLRIYTKTTTGNYTTGTFSQSYNLYDR